jgi:hypothetical protein
MKSLEDQFYAMLSSHALGGSPRQWREAARRMAAQAEAADRAAAIIRRPIQTAMSGHGEPSLEKLKDMADKLKLRMAADHVLSTARIEEDMERREAKTRLRRARQLKATLERFLEAQHRTPAQQAARHRAIERYANDLVRRYGAELAISVLREKLDHARLFGRVDL